MRLDVVGDGYCGSECYEGFMKEGNVFHPLFSV